MYFRNSLIVAASTTTIVTVLATLGAYSLVRYGGRNEPLPERKPRQLLSGRHLPPPSTFATGRRLAAGPSVVMPSEDGHSALPPVRYRQPTARDSIAACGLALWNEALEEA